MTTRTLALTFAVASLLFCNIANADVVQTESNGFQIKNRVEIPLNKNESFKAFVKDIARWWDASHTYTGKAENLSLDLAQRCFLEKLPRGGFVRHLEIAYYEPSKVIRFTGGLGPLQEMGVCGALTVKFSEYDGKTVVEMEYNVSGRNGAGLEKLASSVDQVLAAQFQSYKKHCEKKSVK